MTDDKKPKLTPKEGVDSVISLIPGIMDASANNNLGGLDNILDQLGEIAGAAGLDMAEIGAQLHGVKEQSEKAQHHLANVDAAMWVGDKARVDMLHKRGPQLDYAALGTQAPDVYAEPCVDDAKAAAFAELGIEPVAVDQIIPDRYADIAAGLPGAVDAFLATGQDPNEPTASDQHTAFLAALDAPGRNVDDLQKLMTAGADPLATHVYGDTALSWATGYYHPDTTTLESETAIIRLLVEHGLDINQPVPDFGTPFGRALIFGKAQMVGAMLAAGADADQNLPMDHPLDLLAGATPTIVAAPKPEVLKLLLDHGVDSRLADDQGRYPVEMIEVQAAAAQDRADAADPWTVAHAEALKESLALIKNQLLALS